jgi:dolichyl-phosphate-mannose--protein O-mannosyl transferase
MKVSLTFLSSFLVGLSFIVLSSVVLVAGNSADNDAPDDAVTCGSVVKLTHVETSAASDGGNFFLSSEQKNLGSGSGQQIVTAVENPTTLNTMWWIREPNGGETTRAGDAACSHGTASPIQCGQIIRLTHLETLRNLHSHNVKSPLSRQQEVSGYGQGDGNGDDGDDWKVICSASNAKYWRREAKVYLQHVDSGKFLGASSSVKFTHQNCGHNCPIMNHAEVFARSSQDQYGAWFVEAGVHIHR